MPCHQLIYVSAATQPFGDAALRALVAQVRPHNHGLGLTGLLLHSENLFLQVLEGDKAAVRELYHERIARDPRHTHLRLLADGPAAARVFPDWSMGFLDTIPSDLADLVGHLNLDGPDFLGKHAPETSPVLMALLLRFVGPRMQEASA